MKKVAKVFGPVRKSMEESALNTRRIAENFPLVERKADIIVYDNPFDMEFYLSDHPHTASMTIQIKPPQNCFQCNQGAVVPGGIGSSQCTAYATGGTPSDGNAYPLMYTSFSGASNGFMLDPTGGIMVPRDGVYNVHFTTSTQGVVTTEGAAVVASVRQNGIVKAQRVFSVENGKLNHPLAGCYIGIDMYGLCITCRAGDVLGTYLAATGIAFWSPSGPVISIQMVALA